MTYKDYRKAVKDQSTTWLKGCAKSPSKRMTAVHVAIIKSVLKKR